MKTLNWRFSCVGLAVAFAIEMWLGGAHAFARDLSPYVPTAPDQLMTLGSPAKGDQPRMASKEVSWPSNVGDAEICLWKDDKYAALSITIDDNCRPDHEWWLAQAEKYGFRLTWFIITDKIGKNAGFSGTWEDWRKIVAAGHAVETHTVSHKKASDLSEDELRGEYTNSIRSIEENIPGYRVTCLAYPRGDSNEDVAADYFIAARGTVGTPNRPEAIHYTCTCTGGQSKPYMDAILTGKTDDEKLKWLSRDFYRRGWVAVLYHLVAHGKTPEERTASVAAAEKALAELAQYADSLWFGTFPEVTMYGQERDSAKLTVAGSAGEYSISIHDKMRDDIFTFPLTVKLRVSDGTYKVSAVQNDKPVRAALVNKDGAVYVLVEVVPDQGAVEIKTK